MDSINPLYLSTFLDLGTDWSEQPEEFAIISGYATTGEKWSEERNRQADDLLLQLLVEMGNWLRRVTGYALTLVIMNRVGQQPSLLTKLVILERSSFKTQFTMLKETIYM